MVESLVPFDPVKEGIVLGVERSGSVFTSEQVLQAMRDHWVAGQPLSSVASQLGISGTDTTSVLLVGFNTLSDALTARRKVPIARIEPWVDPNPEIPIHWYSGIGYENTGIQQVAFNTPLLQLDNEQMDLHLIREWQHHTGNKHIQNLSDAPAELIDMLRAAKAYIMLTTGFTPEQLIARRDQLIVNFKGKSQAPFEVHLVERLLTISDQITIDLLKELMNPIFPPLEWYTLLLDKNGKFKNVGYSWKLLSIDDGNMGKQIEQHKKDTIMPESLADETIRHAFQKRVAQADDALDGYMKKTTGYSYHEFSSMRTYIEQIAGRFPELLPQEIMRITV